MTRRVIVQNTLWIAVIAAILFVPAGTLAWPGAWAFLAISAASGLTISLWLARHDPALLAERMAPPIQREQTLWDKVFMGVILVLFCAWLVLMALDAARFHWSTMPLVAQALGAVGIVACLWIAVLTFRENTFAAPVVKIQKDRAQRVVTTGPYAYVRHPMYAGALLYFVGTPLLLGSWYGLAFAPVLVAALAFRIVMEERTLTAGLAGYADYAARVCYRLIPGVW